VIARCAERDRIDDGYADELVLVNHPQESATSIKTCVKQGRILFGLTWRPARYFKVGSRPR